MPKRATKDLTDVKVRNAKPTDSQYEVFDRSVGGFALRVAPGGTKSFVVNYRCNGKARRLILGNAAVMSLADAREAAMVAKSKAKSGIDPREEKRRQDEVLNRERQVDALKGDRTFATIADLFIQRYAKKKKSWREDERILQKFVVSKWGPRHIEDIGRSDVVALLDFVEDTSGLYQANRVLAVVRKLFNWSLVERALIEVTPVVPGMGRKGEKSRTRTLSEDEIPSFWDGAEKLGYPFGLLFRLLLATGQRRDEVASMKWSQLNLEKKLWTIPSSGTKADRGDHIVPLNRLATEIINALPRIGESDLVFPTGSNPNRPVSGFSKAKARCVQLDTNWRLHDLRRTMATVMEDELSIAPHVVGAVLNHDPKSYKGITATYTVGRLLDDRIKAMTAWGRKLESVLDPNAGQNVVPLKQDKEL